MVASLMGVYPDPRQVVFFAFRSFEECSKVDKEGNFVDHMVLSKSRSCTHAPLLGPHCFVDNGFKSLSKLGACLFGGGGWVFLCNSHFLLKLCSADLAYPLEVDALVFDIKQLADPVRGKKSLSTPRRFFRRPPSSAKHTKSMLAMRQGIVKPNNATAVGEEKEGIGMDKSFGFSK
ncbi:hypothetical protein LguiA_012256 [Lonicera macranthoides]